MSARGLDDFIRIAAGGSDEEGGYQGAKRLIEEDIPTAIFAFNDLAAVGALTAIEEAGLGVPHDVSLVGYDNTHLSELRHLRLTSVTQPKLGMGKLAASMIFERLGGRRSRAQHVLLEPSLVVRASSASPGIS